MNYTVQIEREIEAQRIELGSHPVYMGVHNVSGLLRMMEFHIFAQFDYAEISKSTSEKLPWSFAPKSQQLATEYLDTMRSMGADMRSIDTYLSLKKSGVIPLDALRHCGARPEIVYFSTYSHWVAKRAPLHVALGIVAWAREHRVHETFIRALLESSKPLSGRLKPLDLFIPDYLAFPREKAAKTARLLLSDLCKEDDEKWYQVREHVQKTMRLRRRAWDGLLNELVIA